MLAKNGNAYLPREAASTKDGSKTEKAIPGCPRTEIRSVRGVESVETCRELSDRTSGTQRFPLAGNWTSAPLSCDGNRISRSFKAAVKPSPSLKRGLAVSLSRCQRRNSIRRGSNALMKRIKPRTEMSSPDQKFTVQSSPAGPPVSVSFPIAPRVLRWVQIRQRRLERRRTERGARSRSRFPGRTKTCARQKAVINRRPF